MSAGENAKVKYTESVIAILNYDIPEGKTVKGRGKRRVITQDDSDNVIKEKTIITQNNRGEVTRKRIRLPITKKEKREFLTKHKREIGKSG